MNFEQLKQEAYFDYDVKVYDFVGILKKIFNVQDLSNVHELIPEASQPGFLDFDNDQATWFHKTYYASPHLPEFLELYERFVQHVISPMVQGHRVIYQKKPTFRVHLPNNLAVGQKHRDGDYRHPLGEINFWLPFTQVFDTNGIYVETEPDKNDFHNLNMNYGQVFRFYGNQCWHYNEINTTGITRVSIDFRIIPEDMYSEEDVGSTVKAKLQLKIGSYYDCYYKN